MQFIKEIFPKVFSYIHTCTSLFIYNFKIVIIFIFNIRLSRILSSTQNKAMRKKDQIYNIFQLVLGQPAIDDKTKKSYKNQLEDLITLEFVDSKNKYLVQFTLQQLERAIKTHKISFHIHMDVSILEKNYTMNSYRYICVLSVFVLIHNCFFSQ